MYTYRSFIYDKVVALQQVKRYGFMFCLLFILMPKHTIGQPAHYDWQLMESISAKMNSYIAKGRSDSAFIINQQMMDFFEATNDTTILAWYFNNIAGIYLYTGRYDTAATIYSRAETLSLKGHDELLQESITANHCMCLLAINQHVAAYETCNRAIDLAVAHNRPEKMTFTLTNLVQLYIIAEQYDSATVLLDKTAQLAIDNKQWGNLASTYILQGYVEFKDSAYLSALKSYNAALGILDSINTVTLKANVFEKMGLVYTKMDRHHAAIDAYDRSAIAYKNLGHKQYYVLNILSISAAYVRLNDLDKAQQFLDSVAPIIQEQLHNSYQVNRKYAYANRLLADATGDSVKGLQYHLQYLAYEDSIFHKEDWEGIQALKVRYTYDGLIEKLDQLQDSLKTIQQNRNQIVMLGVLLVLVLAALNRYTYSRTQRLKGKNKVLRDQLDDMQSKQLLLQPAAQATKVIIDRQRLTNAVKFPLNDTDWAILHALSKAPNMSNNALAVEIGISHEGVRSSLKKLYKKFAVKNNVANKKLALVMTAMHLSKNNNKSNNKYVVA